MLPLRKHLNYGELEMAPLCASGDVNDTPMLQNNIGKKRTCFKHFSPAQSLFLKQCSKVIQVSVSWMNVGIFASRRRLDEWDHHSLTDR